MIMARINITEAPDGPAPNWRREAWKGLTLPIRRVCYQLPVAMDYEGNLRLWQSGDIPYYPVDKDVAIRELSKQNPEAAEWFRDNLPNLCSELFFTGEVIPLID